MSINSQAEYNSKREEVLSKFSKEFIQEYYKYDADFRVIADMLIRDADPYEIIEQLIIDRKRLIEEKIEFAENHALPVINPPTP